MVLANVIVGAAFFFYAISDGGKGFRADGSWPSVLLYTYETLLLGSYDPEDFDNIKPLVNQVIGKIFFVVLTLVVFILLLNLLIALLSDSYEEVKEREKMEFTMQRADIICELEMIHLTGKGDNQDYFPDVVHILRPSGDVSSHQRQEWKGIAGQIRHDIESSEKRVLAGITEREGRSARKAEVAAQKAGAEKQLAQNKVIKRAGSNLHADTDRIVPLSRIVAALKALDEKDRAAVMSALKK